MAPKANKRVGDRRGDARCPRTICVLLAVILTGGCLSAPARADEASESLVKYDKPVDESIDRALRYLSTQQTKNGAFRSRMRDNVGIASLCVMAYLAKGYTPGTGPYGNVINSGIDYVLSCYDGKSGLIIGPKNGRSHGPMYGHCIATLLLSEVSGMVDAERQEKLDEALAGALKVILSAQQVRKDSRHEGGWRYQARSRDSDISCTGWAMMALRSARGNGAPVPSESIDKAVEYVLKCRHKSGGFQYQYKGSPGLARTGTGLLCLELAGRHGTDPTSGAGKWILEHLPRSFGEGGGFFYYGLYYCSQGMFQLGGDYWQIWAEHMYRMMLEHQRKNGSWPSGKGNENKAGPAYATAMGVLAMSVSYRQLPIYQR